MTDEERQRAIEQKKALKDLTESAGWRTLVAICESQIQQRTDKIVLTMLGEDGWSAHKQEFVKGEVAFGRSFLRLPEIIVDDINAILENTDDNARHDSTSTDDDRNPDSGFEPGHTV